MGTSNHKKRILDPSTMNRMFEGADFLLDMEMTFPFRKMHIIDDFYKEHSKSDADFVTFLENAQAFWNLKFRDDDNDDPTYDNDDPTYKRFLENLTEHGNAYVCNVSVENGVLSPIIYHEMNQSPNELIQVKRKTAPMCIDNHSRKKWKQDDNIKTARKISGQENHSGIKGRRRTPVPCTDDFVRENRSMDIDGDEESGKKYSGLGKKKAEIDESLAFYLKNVRIEGGRAVFEYGEQNRVTYEARNHRATDIEVEPLKTNTRPLTPSMRPPAPVPRPPTPPPRAQISSPKKPMRRRDATNRMTESGIISSYQRDLHKYLRQPYDQSEYNQLFEFVSVRNPVYSHRESRSGGSDRPGHMGKSYLDRYPELKHEIDKVKTDHNKVLNLLRMFTHYLEKLPSLPSRYVPWKDDVLKKILPG